MAAETQTPPFSTLIADWYTASDALGGTATFFVDGANFEDPTQGQLGNCYVIAAMSAVAEYNFDILRNCFQGVDTTQYVPGQSITLKLFSRTQRQWVDIVVEDSFPVDSEGRLLVCTPSDANKDGTYDEEEAWILFLEKACAQLCSWDEEDPGLQYEKCELGSTFCALQWITGAEMVDVIKREDHDQPWYAGQLALDAPNEKDGRRVNVAEVDADQIWQMLRSADNEGELIIFGTQEGFTNEQTGLFEDHAYTIIKVLEMKSGERVLGVRNPHGQAELLEKLQFQFQASAQTEATFDPTGDDGSFYVLFEGLLENISEISIVNYNSGTSRQLALAAEPTSTYTVTGEGETLNSIAADVLGGTVTPEELLMLNPELGLEEEDPEDPYNVVLPIDTVLLLPGGEAWEADEE